MNYGQYFKELRNEKNLSQRDLAKATGISQQAISFWEQNKRTPNMDDCIILADFYEISLDELVGRDRKK
ncbi:MAG: helix-turn-helix transcriptional regulator [Clostridia bacterium]|nr:helix-turn-helix transcriptional regulator [Clostridia bacterium]